MALIPGLGRSPEGGHGKPTPVFLPGESLGHRSLVGYSPWDCKESDTTERLTVSLHLPLQGLNHVLLQLLIFKTP